MSEQANRLYYGDNLGILRNKVGDESVDLCYIDPPFNSKRNYNQIYNKVGGKDKAQSQAFIDTWEWDADAMRGQQEILDNTKRRFSVQTVALINGLRGVLGEDSLLAYLISMTLRVQEIHRVLKPTGSFYLHCDPTASHYLKLVMDSIFTPMCFRNEIIWKRTNAKGSPIHRLASDHDVILLYAKGTDPTWNPQYVAYASSYVEKSYRHIESETGRRYCLGDLTGPDENRTVGRYEFLGVTRRWRWTKERMQKAYDDGLIVQSKPGTVPTRKRYLDEQKGTPVDDTWTDIPRLGARTQERLGYPTQKPEALLERVIQASSNEGDVILDAFCGCGTTVAVAQKLNRRWIGIDITYQSIALVLKRLQDHFGARVADAVVLDGMPKDMASATALANKKDDRVRKEFEKWAVLTYTNNRAVINEQKGADKGIDGTVFFRTTAKENAKVVFQVKSGKVERGDISTLRGDMGRESAPLAVFITLRPPTSDMKAEAKAAGLYHHNIMGRDYDVIRIVTIQEMLEQGVRLDLPLSLDVLKEAQAKQEGQTITMDL